VLYTDGLVEFSHNPAQGQARLIRAAQAAVDVHAKHPAKFIVENVLQDEPQRHPDDIAVLTISFL
jgi:hypothetical protein